MKARNDQWNHAHCVQGFCRKTTPPTEAVGLTFCSNIGRQASVLTAVRPANSFSDQPTFGRKAQIPERRRVDSRSFWVNYAWRADCGSFN